MILIPSAKFIFWGEGYELEVEAKQKNYFSKKSQNIKTKKTHKFRIL